MVEQRQRVAAAICSSHRAPKPALNVLAVHSGTGTSNVAATTRVVAGDELMLWSVPEKLPRIHPPAAEIASIVSPHAGSAGSDGMYWGADMGRYVMKFVVLSQPVPT